MALEGAQLPHLVFELGDLATNGDVLDYKLFELPAGMKFTITAAKVAAKAAVAAANTNYNTLRIKSGTNSDLSTGEIANATLANGPVSGGVDVSKCGGSMTLNVPVIGSTSARTYVWFDTTKEGDGLAITGASVHIWGYISQ